MKGFNFNATDISGDGKNKRIDNIKLIQYLQPGDWIEHVEHVNNQDMEPDNEKYNQEDRTRSVAQRTLKMFRYYACCKHIWYTRWLFMEE